MYAPVCYRTLCISTCSDLHSVEYGVEAWWKLSAASTDLDSIMLCLLAVSPAWRLAPTAGPLAGPLVGPLAGGRLAASPSAVRLAPPTMQLGRPPPVGYGDVGPAAGGMSLQEKVDVLCEQLGTPKGESLSATVEPIARELDVPTNGMGLMEKVRPRHRRAAHLRARPAACEPDVRSLDAQPIPPAAPCWQVDACLDALGLGDAGPSFEGPMPPTRYPPPEGFRGPERPPERGRPGWRDAPIGYGGALGYGGGYDGYYGGGGYGPGGGYGASPDR